MTQNQDLREELLRRFERDQTARQAEGTAQFEAMTRVDAENLPWLKQVLAKTGWPGKSEVGVDGAQAAWLLAQHADADPQFQRHCLDLLTAAAEQGDPDTVDQRRAAVPLEPIAEYLARMAQQYGPPQPAVLTCPQCGGPVEFSIPGHAQEVTLICPGCGRTREITAST